MQQTICLVLYIADQSILECISRGQLCDGVNDCSGSDEGETLISLNCGKLVLYNSLTSQILSNSDQQYICTLLSLQSRGLKK